jgi:hypothetical protein
VSSFTFDIKYSSSDITPVTKVITVNIGCFDETDVILNYATPITDAAAGVIVGPHSDGDHAFKIVLQPDAASYSFLLS